MTQQIRKSMLLTAFGLVVVSIVIYLLWYTGIFYDIGIGWCFPPPGVMVDSAIYGDVFTWIDTDRDGVYDADEQPMRGVNVHFGPTSKLTDATGVAGFFLFRPGCACNCGSDIIISSDIPVGMRSTTPTQLPFDGRRERYFFGFVQADA